MSTEMRIHTLGLAIKSLLQWGRALMSTEINTERISQEALLGFNGAVL